MLYSRVESAPRKSLSRFVGFVYNGQMQSNPVIQSVSQWFQRTFSDPDAITLFLTLVLAIVALELFGTILMPALVSIVIAYLLNPIVKLFTRFGCPHLLAVLVIFILFLGSLAYGLIVLVPVLIKQLSGLVQGLPDMFNHGQAWLEKMMHRYPQYLSTTQIKDYTAGLQHHVATGGQLLLKYSLANIPNIIHLVLYLVLIPLFVFFFMKDSDRILQWFAQYQPRNQGLTLKVWYELNQKIGAYVKGRVFELLVIGILSSIAFEFFDLQYAILLAVAVGISVIIPYVGAILVTVPVFIVSLVQFGWTPHFLYFLLVYMSIIIFDGHILVPWLFSESMKLHPLVIILSIIIFGGIWGFWGVFFAIPLATLIDVVLRAWPRTQLSV